MIRSAPAQPARVREAVARYLPVADEQRFARSLAAYARCQDECQDRRAGDPECGDACRRAHVSGRKA